MDCVAISPQGSISLTLRFLVLMIDQQGAPLASLFLSLSLSPRCAVISQSSRRAIVVWSNTDKTKNFTTFIFQKPFFGPF